MNTIIVGGNAPSVFETLPDHQVVAWACSEFHRRTGHAAFEFSPTTATV
ncbi:hypothetical protein [Paraburkholderia sp. RL17-381-BIF-C]|jgi:hypothetical protein